MKGKTLALFGILGLLGLGSAWAGSASDQFNVTATVLTNCQITAGNTLAFGTYDPLSATDTDNTTTIQVRCTKGTTATVEMNNGLNFSGGTRRMSDGTNFLNYGLFQDAARTQPWGTGSDAYTYNATNNGWQTLTVYGRIPAGQDVPAGNYQDTVTATINF